MKKLITAIFAFTLMCSMSAFAKDSTKKAEKAPAPKTMKLKGTVSDAKCGAHVAEGCTKKCVDAGEKMVFVNDADQKVWAVNNQDALKGHEGHHVQIKAAVHDDGSIDVQGSPKMIAEKKAKKDDMKKDDMMKDEKQS
jgi:hypothetical protein